MALATKVRPAQHEAEVRAKLEALITQLAQRVLSGYTDEQLLGQPQARTITAVRRAVRHELSETVSELANQVSRWRLTQLLGEPIAIEVRKHQRRALIRRHEAEEGAEELGDTPAVFAIRVDAINGVEHYALTSSAEGNDGRYA